VRVLIIEDDTDTAALLVEGLMNSGHSVDSATCGRDGLVFAIKNSYDVIVIDRMLPDIDGVAIVRAIRGVGLKVPVLFVTACEGLDEKVEALNAGGDDYLTKPFAFSEFLARLNALARRPPLVFFETVLHAGDLELDLIARTVTRAGRKIDLAPLEFELLSYLLRNTNRVVTRTMALEAVWGLNFDPKTKIVATHISRLRRKVETGACEKLIHTIRGAGYITVLLFILTCRHPAGSVALECGQVLLLRFSVGGDFLGRRDSRPALGPLGRAPLALGRVGSARGHRWADR
jgi:two-component system, OmpR family, response regulator